MKGQLYLPHGKDIVPLPSWINTQRRLGQWGHHIEKDFYRLQRHEWICPDLEQSSPAAQWWCNGLYYDTHTLKFYMYRQAPLAFSLT